MKKKGFVENLFVSFRSIQNMKVMLVLKGYLLFRIVFGPFQSLIQTVLDRFWIVLGRFWSISGRFGSFSDRFWIVSDHFWTVSDDFGVFLHNFRCWIVSTTGHPADWS